MSGTVAGTSALHTDQCLAQIASTDHVTRAFVHVLPDTARATAKASDQRRTAGASLGALDGVTVAIKDNIDIVGLPTAGGIEHYRHAVALRDAAIVQQLRMVGAVIIGKTNLHEAAFGATTDNPWFGRTDNPRRAGYTAGGSSGGSAAAVAAGMCALALGTDTMGSVRIPAAYCGVVGFKPARGALSLEGVMPLSPTLDHVGLLAASAAQIASVWSVFEVPSFDTRVDPMLDPRVDPTVDSMAGTAVGATAPVHPIRQPGAVRLGVVNPLPDGLASADLARLLTSAAEYAQLAGYAVSHVALGALAPSTIRRDGFVLTEIEAALVHAAALAANPEGFSPQLRAMLAYGARQTRARAREIRARLAVAAAQVAALLDGVDALLLPTAPQGAFAHGTRVPDTQADFCALANLGGLPAISIPWGVDHNGMPLALQIVGAAGQNWRVIEIACRLEQARDG